MYSAISVTGNHELAMTNVHILPATAGPSAVQRLVDELASAFESGSDLGSRVPHIHKQITSLDNLVLKLRAEADAIDANPDFGGLEKRRLLTHAEELGQQVDRIAAAALQMLP